MVMTMKRGEHGRGDDMSELLPASASKGANNGLYIQCEKMGFRRKYFVCLHTLDSYRRGEAKEGTQTADCGRALDCGSCVANKMHKEEIDKGEAIYFEQDPYHTQLKSGAKPKPSFNYDSGRRALGVESKSPVRDKKVQGVSSLKTTKAPKKETSTYDSMDVAKLVTDMAEEESKILKAKEQAIETKKPVVTVRQKPTRLAGESLIEMGRRLKREKQL